MYFSVHSGGLRKVEEVGAGRDEYDKELSGGAAAYRDPPANNSTNVPSAALSVPLR